MITKEYALFCEFATMSVNGMQSYMHVFDRTAYPAGSPIVLRGFFATRIVGLPPEGNMEIYLTDSSNTLIDKGQLFKNTVKGPGSNIVIRIGGVQVPGAGEYSVWGRVDGGEPIKLCTWTVEEKAATKAA
ncbi:MAG: hypothetical protein WAZ14_03945 [Patescibacteria group bacterium]